jgi:hypothetical protein
MALTQAQRQAAQFIMGLGARRGLSPAHQRELAAVAYAESGLNPRAVNKSSGAAGYFQLLSPGYRQKAQQLGGLFDPRANTLAILGDYVNYWKQHPGAPAGAAGRDVERSGMGADFYARPLSMLGGVAGDGSVPPVTSPTVPGAAAGPSVRPGDAIRNLLIRSLASGQRPTPTQIVSTIRQGIAARQQATASAEPVSANVGNTFAAEAPGSSSGKGLVEAFYDPLGQYDNGRFSNQGIGGHSDHVHLSITNPQTMISAISKAQQMGLRVGENPYTDPVDPVHVKGSFHYKTFPGMFGGKRLGEGIDVSGDSAAMAAYYRWATDNLR